MNTGFQVCHILGMHPKQSHFSIPVVVGRSGIIRHLHPEMNDDEQQTLRTAAVTIKSTIVSLIPDLVG